jgi:hypothetical protein
MTNTGFGSSAAAVGGPALERHVTLTLGDNMPVRNAHALVEQLVPRLMSYQHGGKPFLHGVERVRLNGLSPRVTECMLRLLPNTTTGLQLWRDGNSAVLTAELLRVVTSWRLAAELRYLGLCEVEIKPRVMAGLLAGLPSLSQLELRGGPSLLPHEAVVRELLAGLPRDRDPLCIIVPLGWAARFEAVVRSLPQPHPVITLQTNKHG